MSRSLFDTDQRRLTLATMSAIAVAAYNNLSVSAAIPTIGDDLGQLDLLPWIITIELIASAIAVLAIGPIIDSVGTRTVFRWTLALFTLSSAACAVAPNVAFLIVARGCQGLAVGAIVANVMAAMGLGVPEALRARAYATNSSVWGIMGLAGPAVAALILTVADWSAIFWVNVPVAVVAGVVGWNAFPGPAPDSVASPSDGRGLLILVAFTLLSLGAVSTLAWWTPLVLIGAITAVLVYVRHERTAEPPVLRLRHVVAPHFRMLHLTAFLVISAGISANTFLPVYVKGVRSASAAEAAFTVVFMTVGWTVGAFLSSCIGEKSTGENAVVVSTTTLLVGACVAAVGVAAAAPLALIFLGFFATGMGMGGASSAGLGVLQRHAKPTEMGRVNAAHQFIRTLGFSYGAAAGGALIFVTVQRQLGDANLVRSLLGEQGVTITPEAVDALDQGFSRAVFVGAILAVAALACARRLPAATSETPSAEASRPLR